MDEIKYSAPEDLESYAVCFVPEDIEELKSIDEIQEKISKEYKVGHFPKNAVMNKNYVIAGMNPGDSIDSHDKSEKYLNFHGIKKSGTDRLAAALWDTDFWGAYMTDVSREISSKSSKVKISNDTINDFFDRLSEADVTPNAPIITLGKAAFNGLTKKPKKGIDETYNKIDEYHFIVRGHDVYYIPHYSNGNNAPKDKKKWTEKTPHVRWDTETVHKKILNIQKNHKK